MKARYNDYPTVGREDKTEALGINEEKVILRADPTNVSI